MEPGMIVLNGALDSMNVEEREDGFPAGYWEDHKAMILETLTRLL